MKKLFINPLKYISSRPVSLVVFWPKQRKSYILNVNCCSGNQGKERNREQFQMLSECGRVGGLWVRVEESEKDKPSELSTSLYYDLCAEPVVNFYDALYCIGNSA